jgi:acetyl-CoA acetyltransferase
VRIVEVAGVGMTRFGKHLDRSIPSLACEAFGAALTDAGLVATDIEAVAFANAAGGLMTGQEMIRGQVALKNSGLRGVPIINVENACASGGTAAHVAWMAVASGQAETAAAIGAEKLNDPDKQKSFDAIRSGTDLSLPGSVSNASGSVMMAAYAQQARRYADRFGNISDALSAIAVKNRRFASLCPTAQFRHPITAEDVAASRVVADPLRLLTCSPLSDGAAAVIFTSERGATSRPTVRMPACIVRSHEEGRSTVEEAASRLFGESGLHPSEIDVFQLHDACAYAELIQYEQVGLVPQGEAARAAIEGKGDIPGEFPVNTDGGLLSRGHPLGATGLAQLVELTTQLRGTATGRQVEGARFGVAINGGGWMGDDYGAAVASLLTTAG